MIETTLEKSQSAEGGNSFLDNIDHLDQELSYHFQDKFVINGALTRQMVSFQANKTRPLYRWYKYKEAFSASLVEYFINTYGIDHARLLDPFAGSGTAIFTASNSGLEADGIELLPIAQEIISTRQCIEKELNKHDQQVLHNWATNHPWENSNMRETLNTLRITEGAYPHETLDEIECYLVSCAFK